MTRFNHLNVPQHWEQYWSKYPQGYTILEALINWVSQVDQMVDNVNDWNEYLESFVETYDERLQAEVEKTLQEWQESGFLEVVISESVSTEINRINKKVTFMSVKEFGAIGDGIADDTLAVQAAADNGGYIFFPQGIYRVTGTININKTVVFVGVDYSIDIKTDNSSVIWFDSSIENKELFHSTVPNSKFTNMYFRGNNFNTDRRTWSKGFIFDKGTVYGDTDIDFQKCHFKRFSYCVEFEGRGFKASDCSFEEIWVGVKLKHFNNNEAINVPQYDWQTNKRGFRKFHFVNNVFHSTQGYCVECTSTTAANNEQHIHQVVFTGNRHDGTGGIWLGFIGGAAVTGNTLGKAGSAVYGQEARTFELHGAKSLTITGNTISSELDGEAVLGNKPSLGDFIALVNGMGGVFQDITVIGNTFTNLGKRILMAFATVTRFTFSNNTVSGVLLEKTDVSEAPFRFLALGSYIVIRDNLIKGTAGIKHNYLAQFDNRGVLKSTIEGNIVDVNEFAVTHNLYNYNMFDKVKMNNYTGDGAATQVLTFESPVLFVVIADYAGNKTIMKRTGTSNGNTLVEIVDNLVTVKGTYNTSGVTYSIIAYTV